MRSRASSGEPGCSLRETRGGEAEPGWSLSFAGCGFRSVYYIGALSCLLQQVPELVHGAARFSGASSGCLVAAALAVGLPLSEFFDIVKVSYYCTLICLRVHLRLFHL